jgi:uncharacterized repeat protein (TIGR03803 family)
VLHSFTGTGGDGANPFAGLIMDASGNLYGTTVYGGDSSSDGTVFELVNNSGSYTEKVLHTFTVTGVDGGWPFAGLVMDASGNLYGTTEVGNPLEGPGYGTVFELVNSSGSYTETTLYTFADTGDGGNPIAGLVRDSAGNLYGTARIGGASGLGTVFELVNFSGSYSFTVLHSFTDTDLDGALPYAGLVMDASGNLYGTASGGGPSIFELVNNSGTYTEQVLCNCGGSYAGLIMDASGNLYGTTLGDVFELANPSSVFPTTTTLTSSLNPANLGDSIAFNATVTSAPGLLATGQVSFLEGSTVLGTSTVVNGSAVLTVDAAIIGIGSYTITAQFTPNVSYLTASSGTLSQTVTENGVALTTGNNTFSGNQTINGTVSATGFTGNGAGLTNVTASGLACAACVGNYQLGINYAGSATQGGPATNALALGGLPASGFASTGANSFTGAQIINGNLTATGALSAAAINITGPFSTADLLLPAGGTATASQGYNSGALDSSASLFNSTAGAAQNMLFRWQAEPVASSNNTANPTATLNLLYGANATPSETGLSVNHDGTINFSAGQTFPGAGSTGTITGVTAGAGLSGGGTAGSVTLSIPASGVTDTMLANPSLTLNPGTGLSGGGSVALGGSTTLALASNACAAGSALTALPFTCSAFATNGSNTFKGNQSVTGTVTATAFSGNGAGLTNVNAASATSAAVATNALALGGNAPSYYASTGSNTFTGSQTMASLTVSGAIQGGLNKDWRRHRHHRIRLGDENHHASRYQQRLMHNLQNGGCDWIYARDQRHHRSWSSQRSCLGFGCRCLSDV